MRNPQTKENNVKHIDQIDSEKALVVQSNKLLQARSPMTLNQAKLVLVVVGLIDKNDTDFVTYRIRKKAIRDMFGGKNKNIFLHI